MRHGRHHDEHRAHGPDEVGQGEAGTAAAAGHQATDRYGEQGRADDQRTLAEAGDLRAAHGRGQQGADRDADGDPDPAHHLGRQQDGQRPALDAADADRGERGGHRQTHDTIIPGNADRSRVAAGHRPRPRPMISFMISVVPP
jgi:hypothetical protein